LRRVRGCRRGSQATDAAHAGCWPQLERRCDTAGRCGRMCSHKFSQSAVRIVG
jgi:hypothetical protein